MPATYCKKPYLSIIYNDRSIVVLEVRDAQIVKKALFRPDISEGPGKIFIDIRGLFAIQTFLITKPYSTLRVKRFEFK